MRRAGVGIRHVVPDTPPSNISPASIANCLPHTCPVTPSTTSITNGMCLSVPDAQPNRLPTTSTTNGMPLPIPHMLPTFLSPASITSGMSLGLPHTFCPTLSAPLVPHTPQGGMCFHHEAGAGPAASTTNGLSLSLVMKSTSSPVSLQHPDSLHSAVVRTARTMTRRSFPGRSRSVKTKGIRTATASTMPVRA